MTNCLQKEQLGSNEQVYIRRKRDYCSKKQYPPWSLFVCLEMEQFLLLPLSVFNSSNNPIIVTKQELPKQKTEQTPTYHKDTLKKEINQQLSTSASSLVNKILESPFIKLSKSNTLILDGRATGVLLKDCGAFESQKRTRTRHLLYLTRRSQHHSRHCCQQSCKGYKKRSLDPFKNLNNERCRDFTRKDLQHMVLCAIQQKQRNSLRQRSENVYIQRLHMPGLHKQHVNSKEWEPLPDLKMKFGVWI